MLDRLGLTIGELILFGMALLVTVPLGTFSATADLSTLDQIRSAIHPWLIAGILSGVKWCISLPFARLKPNFKLDLAWMALVIGLLNWLIVAISLPTEF